MVDYCGNCGEPLQGPFCRMCGTPVAGTPTAAPAATAAMPSAPAGMGALPGAAVGAPPMAVTGTGYATQSPVYAAPAASGYGAGPEPTQMLGATPVEFDGYFRNEDGSPGAHGQTQVLPPVVEADYRMQPPGTTAQPPGGYGPDGDDDEDEPRSNRPVILATVGAVVVAAGLILGLLYLGNQGTSGSPSAASGTSAAPTVSAGAAQGGKISVPTDGATLGPTAPASTANPDTAGAFHGDSLPLGPGSSGAWVKWVQERLKQLGYYDGSATGSYDQATALAVQRFQAKAGVTGDAASTVGLHTIVALEAAGDTPPLHVNSKGSAVSRLNAALTYATGIHLSGSRYTMGTAAAVFRYQQAVGLQPTGQVDAATWAKLQDGTLATG